MAKRKKVKTIKGIMNRESAKETINFLKEIAMPFKLTISNYTTKIECEIFSKQYLTSMRSNECFAAFQKIKSDVKNKPIPHIDKKKIQYYDHDIRDNYFSSEVYNIDLKSAYANVLLNEKYISDDTGKYLARLSKMDRLAAVGMLAGKKYVIEYNADGQIINTDRLMSETENFFLFAVDQTSKIMTELKKHIGSAYFYTWVDGIYFERDERALKKVTEYLQDCKYPFSFDVIQNFSCIIKKKFIQIAFEKEGLKKAFNIPNKHNQFAEDLYNYFTKNNTV